jgi:hypothetical protein
MQLLQGLLGARMPLVGDSIGASRFWLYHAFRPRLPSLRLKLFVPLITVQQLMLGARTRTSLLRGSTNQLLLSNWDLEFPSTEEVQDFVEVFPSEPNTGVQQGDGADRTASQVESFASELISPQLRQLKSTPTNLSQSLESNSNQTDWFEPQDESLQLSLTVIKQRQQTNESWVSEQLESPQFTSEDLQQDQQLEQSLSVESQGFDKADQLDQNIKNQQTEDIFLSSSVVAEADSNPHSAAISKTDIQPLSNSNSPNKKHGRKQTKNQKRQRLATDVAKHNSGEDKQKSQSISKPRGKKEPAKLNLEKKNFTENPDLSDLFVSDGYATVSEMEVGSIDGEIQNPNSNSVDKIDDKSNRTTPKLSKKFAVEQGKIDELTAEKNQLMVEPMLQPIEEMASIDQVSTDAKLIHQIEQTRKPKLSESLSFPFVLSQEFKTSVPLQGFSVGGQVLNTRAPAKTIDASDTVPAMLTPGEFVVNVTDAQKHLSLLHHINQGGSLEIISDQGQAAKNPQTVEQALKLKHSVLPTLSSQKLVARLTDSPRLLPENLQIQTHHFEESYVSQPKSSQTENSYEIPDLIFRSQHASSAQRLNHLPNTSPIVWNSVEDLLQITDDVLYSHPVDSNESNDRSETILYHSSLNEFITSESDENLPQQNALQTATETVRQTSSSNAKNLSDPKTLEAALETLAQEIYARLRQRLIIERERQGTYTGRLPW